MKIGAHEAFQYMCTAGAFFVLALCDYEHTCTPDVYNGPPHPGGACGSRLDGLVRFFCSIKLKRSVDHFSDDSSRDLDSSEISSSDFSSLPTDFSSLPTKKRLSNPDKFEQTRALQFLRWRRTDYNSQNIVCECCYNNCNVREWRQYC